jgi:hypothetical protein
MNIIRFMLCAWLAVASSTAFSEEAWQSALSRMPLGATVTELNLTNCVPLMLNAFQSNGVVKAFVFMPGAADEIYFFRRAHAALTNANPSLLDAVTALTNQTYIQATFRPPFLLLYTTEDFLDGNASVKNESTAAKLRQKFVPGKIAFNDSDWDGVRAALNNKLSVGLRPFSNAPVSWHFCRHNFACAGVTEWEMLEAIALAGKTTFTIHWRTATFKPDERRGVAPDLKNLQMP